MEYYERLRQARGDEDKTQTEIAELLQTSQSYYSKLELGKKPFRVEWLIKLCEYYGISADYILGMPKGQRWPRDWQIKRAAVSPDKKRSAR